VAEVAAKFFKEEVNKSGEKLLMLEVDHALPCQEI